MDSLIKLLMDKSTNFYRSAFICTPNYKPRQFRYLFGLEEELHAKWLKISSKVIDNGCPTYDALYPCKIITKIAITSKNIYICTGYTTDFPTCASNIIRYSLCDPQQFDQFLANFDNILECFDVYAEKCVEKQLVAQK